MALVSPKIMLKRAQEHKYAIGAFSVINYETLKAVIDAAEHCKSPVICQISEKTISKYISFDYFAPMAVAVAKKAKVNVVLQLDNGSSVEVIKKAIDYGFTSVMFDGSSFDLETNTKKTKEIVDYAHKHNVTVEGELGIVSRVDETSFEAKKTPFANPEEAKKFAADTKVDMLAIAFGAYHGIYDDVPELNFNILKETENLTKCPLVMHGASGISYQNLSKAIKFGISKINVETDLLISYKESIETFFTHNPNIFDMRQVNLVAIT